MKKPTFIGGGKPGERHAVLGDDQIYCEWQGAASAPVITHSGVKCEFCRKTLAGLHSSARENPIPKDSFSGSWVVTEKLTGKVVGEFFNQKTVEKINTKKYLVETAGQYLGRINRESRVKKVRFIGGGKPGERHAVLGNDQIYCEWQGDSSAPVITHSGVKCEFCKKTLAGLHYVGGVSSNPWTGKQELILWGYHKSISYVPVKLSEFSKSEQKRREKEGWKTAVYAKGDEPIGLIAQARREAANDLMKNPIARRGKGLIHNPVPSYAMILRRKLAKGHSQEEAEELARRELQQANIFLSEGRKKNYPRKSNPLQRNGPVKIYGQTEKIFMKKTAGPYKGQKFVHDFKGGVRQIGLPRGTKVQFPDGRSARLTTRSVLLDGKKDLWRNFAA
jgi:hypothetical protein